MSPPASERAAPIAPHVHVTHTLRPSYGARTAQRATAIEIRFHTQNTILRTRRWKWYERAGENFRRGTCRPHRTLTGL